MAKVTNNPKEKMRMNIELADNGIIIRNPDEEDEVMLALDKSEPRAIGQKIYSWLMDVVIQEHESDLIITNFDIDVVATCKGHEFK